MRRSITHSTPPTRPQLQPHEPPPACAFQGPNPLRRGASPPAFEGLPPRRLSGGAESPTAALRDMLGDHVWRDESSPPDAAASGPTDTPSQRGLAILAEWIDTGNWASVAGDIAPQLATRLPDWPAGRSLVVHQPGQAPLVFGEARWGRTPVEIWRQDNHYSALVGDRLVPVPGDGDCFYHAAITAMGEDARAFHPVAESRAIAMRQSMAGLVRRKPQEIARWVDLQQIARSAPPPPAPSASPDAMHMPLPDLVRSSEAPGGDRLERSIAALNELLTHARIRLSQDDSAKPLNGDLIRKCALRHGVDPGTLAEKINHQGILGRAGHADVQSWQNRVRGVSNRPITAAFLKSLQAQFRSSGPDLRCTDRLVVQVALRCGVSITHLRDLIGVSGEFSAKGQAMVDRAERKARHAPTRRLPPEILQHLQREAFRLGLRLEGHLLSSLAQQLNVPFRTLRRSIRADAIITPYGEQLLAAAPKINSRLTSAMLLEIQVRVLNRNSTLEAQAKDKNVSIHSLNKYLNSDGTLTVLGGDFLYRNALADKGEKLNPVSVDALMKLRALIKASDSFFDEDFLDYSRANHMPFPAFKRYINSNGEFTDAGNDFIRTHAVAETAPRSFTSFTMGAPDGNAHPPDPPMTL
jgi:hypothetical protein